MSATWQHACTGLVTPARVTGRHHDQCGNGRQMRVGSMRQNICSMRDMRSHGRLANKKNISRTHVNEAFNEEMQVHFVHIRIHSERYEVLNMVDLGTRYGERTIINTICRDNLQRAFETQCSYNTVRQVLLGAPYCKMSCVAAFRLLG